jgi:hypothetical protein
MNRKRKSVVEFHLFDELSIDLTDTILSYLPPLSMLRLPGVCTTFRNLYLSGIHANYVFQDALLRDFLPFVSVRWNSGQTTSPAAWTPRNFYRALYYLFIRETGTFGVSKDRTIVKIMKGYTFFRASKLLFRNPDSDYPIFCMNMYGDVFRGSGVIICPSCSTVDTPTEYGKRFRHEILLPPPQKYVGMDCSGLHNEIEGALSCSTMTHSWDGDVIDPKIVITERKIGQFTTACDACGFNMSLFFAAPSGCEDFMHIDTESDEGEEECDELAKCPRCDNEICDFCSSRECESTICSGNDRGCCSDCSRYTFCAVCHRNLCGSCADLCGH